MLGRGRGVAVPAQLRVVVGVDVDEAGAERPAAGVDLDFAPALERADRGDAVAGHAQVAPEGGPARSVDDVGVAYGERKHGRFPAGVSCETHNTISGSGAMGNAPPARRARAKSAGERSIAATLVSPASSRPLAAGSKEPAGCRRYKAGEDVRASDARSARRRQRASVEVCVAVGGRCSTSSPSDIAVVEAPVVVDGEGAAGDGDGAGEEGDRQDEADGGDEQKGADHAAAAPSWRDGGVRERV